MDRHEPAFGELEEGHAECAIVVASVVRGRRPDTAEGQPGGPAASTDVVVGDRSIATPDEPRGQVRDDHGRREDRDDDGEVCLVQEQRSDDDRAGQDREPRFLSEGQRSNALSRSLFSMEAPRCQVPNARPGQQTTTDSGRGNGVPPGLTWRTRRRASRG